MGFTNNHQPHQRLAQVSCLSAVPLSTPSTPFLPQPMAAPHHQPTWGRPSPMSELGWEAQARQAPRAGLHLPTKAGAEPRKCPQLHADTWWRPHGRGAHSKKQAGTTAPGAGAGPTTGRLCWADKAWVLGGRHVPGAVGKLRAVVGTLPGPCADRVPGQETHGAVGCPDPHAPIALQGGVQWLAPRGCGLGRQCLAQRQTLPNSSRSQRNSGSGNRDFAAVGWGGSGGTCLP